MNTKDDKEDRKDPQLIHIRLLCNQIYRGGGHLIERDFYTSREIGEIKQFWRKLNELPEWYRIEMSCGQRKLTDEMKIGEIEFQDPMNWINVQLDRERDPKNFQSKKVCFICGQVSGSQHITELEFAPSQKIKQLKEQLRKIYNSNPVIHFELYLGDKVLADEMKMEEIELKDPMPFIFVLGCCGCKYHGNDKPK